MNSKRSQFTLAMAGIIVAGAILLTVGLILLSKQQAGVRAQHEQTQEARKKLAAITEKLERRKSLEDEKAVLAEQLRTLDRDLAPYEYMPTYLVELQRKAVATGNELVSISPSEIKPFDPAKSPFATEAPAPAPKPGDTVTDKGGKADDDEEQQAADKKKSQPTDLYQRINIDITGTYASVMRFLEALRGFRKLVYVRTVELSPIRDKGTLKGVTARLETYAIITPEQYNPKKEQKSGPAEGAELIVMPANPPSTPAPAAQGGKP